ncbi:hypothetical protein Tco_1031710 [Tanacetum coccineum]|uniref:Reverse transcriptase Ty1/copia-type domain-containing protein n=1 Tax=Tanacetum coccineum TaxID=301880 RepID=A0ABQ5GBH5_9ASTR
MAVTEDSWFEAMQNEIHEFDRLEVWVLVPKPKGVMIIALKLIYKVKLDEYGDFLKNKARVSSKEDFVKTEATKNMIIYQMDVKTAFLNGDLQEEVFVRLQVSQSLEGIFINQAKYALETLKKYGMDLSDPVDTPMVDRLKLDKDLLGIPVYQTRFRGMVDSLMYLTASRPDLVFAVCMCARYQAKPTKKYLEAIKHMRIMRDVKIQEEVRREVLSFLEIDWLVGHHRTLSIKAHRHTSPFHRGNLIKVNNKEWLKLYFVETNYQLADILTKALPRERFEFLLLASSMEEFTQKTLRRLQEREDE